MRPIARLLAGARKTRLGVNHHLARQKAGVGQWPERKQGSRGIAAGIRHEPRSANGRVVSFRQAVDRPERPERGGGIPLLAGRRASQPKRTRQINDADAALQEGWRRRGRRFLWQRQKHHVCLPGQPIERKGLDDPVPDPVKRRQRA
jgi:hypothetical protein